MIIDIFGFSVPLEWVLVLGGLFFTEMGITFFIVIRGRGNKRTPGIERMAILTGVSREGHQLPGDLVEFATRTDDTGIIEHPDWKDNQGEQYQSDVDIRGVVPERFLDKEGNIKELWHFFNIDGQIVAGSMETMIKPFIANHNGHNLIDESKLEPLAKQLVETARSPSEMLEFLRVNIPPVINNGDSEHPLEPLPLNPRDAAPFFLAGGSLRSGIGKLLRDGTFWMVLILTIVASLLGGFLLEASRVGRV